MTRLGIFQNHTVELKVGKNFKGGQAVSSGGEQAGYFPREVTTLLGARCGSSRGPVPPRHPCTREAAEWQRHATRAWKDTKISSE